MLHQILLIAKNTYLETVRDRVILGGTIISFFAVLFSLFIGSISVEQNTRIIIDLSLSSIYILQVFISIFIGATLLSKEIERKTLFLLIPKVTRRESLLVGKIAGLLLVVFVVTLINLILLLALLYSRTGFAFAWIIGVSLVYSLIESAILIVIAIFFSLFTSPILSVLFTSSLFLIGHSQAILKVIILKSPVVLAKFLSIFYYVLPNLEKFNIRNDVIYKLAPEWKNFLFVLLYASLYTALIFSISRILFKKKEF